MGRSENMLRGRVPSQSCLFFMHRQDPAMLRAVPGRWWLHRKAPPRWARGPWSRGGHLEALLGAGAEPARKVPLTPSSGVGAGRQRGPVRSVWEHTATTTGHEIGSSGATPPRGVCLEWPRDPSLSEVGALPTQPRPECGPGWSPRAWRPALRLWQQPPWPRGAPVSRLVARARTPRLGADLAQPAPGAHSPQSKRRTFVLSALVGGAGGGGPKHQAPLGL